MEFFNRKEEVLDIQLTQYGKYLLSRGKFKPDSYAFFDDDVLYDAEYAKILEDQKEADPRIKETPRSKTQYVFTGREFEKSKVNTSYCPTSIDAKAPEKFQMTADREYSLGLPLGTSELKSSKAPAWSLHFLKGALSGSTSHISGSNRLLTIPQLEVKVQYLISAHTAEESNEDVDDMSITTTTFDDGSYLKITRDNIILKIEEENAPFTNSNFEIEVFETKTDENGLEQLIPIRFLNDQFSFQDDKCTVGNYFNILVDDEIEEDVPITQPVDIYGLDADSEEPCD